ncbi:MAG: hypothetical protein AUI14_05500 [Actinobacteria bacterium 13_2_20CM_2_71_6]|nr:MAG: hypothetical protein AUI14_05500 [Actinobacteria bacterium 13_2_20CM_2_71_6]
MYAGDDDAARLVSESGVRAADQGVLRRWTARLTPSAGLGPTFNRIWAALTVSLIGSEITALAIPLIAAMSLHGSPFQVGLVAAASSLPTLLLSLPAGVAVDMLPRRRVMVTTDILSAVIVGVLPLAWIFDFLSIGVLCLVAFGVGACAICFEIAHYAFVPSVVTGDRVVDANSRLQISYSAADFIGPGVAGAIIQVLTAPFAVVLDALSFVFSAVLLGRVREKPIRQPEEERPTIRQALSDGLRFLVGEPTLRPIILLAGGTMIFNSALASVQVLYFIRELGFGALAIGALFTVASVGAIPGAALAKWSGKRFGVGVTIIGGWALSSLSGVAIPLVGGSRVLAFVVLGLTFAAGAAVFTAANVQQWTLRQLLAPQSLGGRVTAGYRFAVQGVGVIGTAGGGYLAGVIGMRPALIIYAIGGALVPLLGFLTPLRRVMTLPPSVNPTTDD